MRYPLMAEMTYRRMLYDVVSIVRNEIMIAFNAEGEAVVRKAEEFRTDAFEDLLSYANQVTSIMNRVSLRVKDTLKYSVSELDRVASEVLNVSRREWQRMIMAAFKQNFIWPEPWVPSVISAWKARNTDLITNIAEETIRKIKDRIMETLRVSPSLSNIRATILETVANTWSRADLIAGDQTSKLNATLNEQRQREFHVVQYTWRTMRDEKVRKTHADHEGNVYSWNLRPSTTGHPAEDPNCRCWAEPVFPHTSILVRP